MAFAIARNCSRRPSNTADWGLSGFATTINAPARMASKESSTSSRLTLEDTRTIGTGARTMISLVASKPSMTGMWTSIVTRSGLSCFARSTPASPLSAVVTS